MTTQLHNLPRKTDSYKVTHAPQYPLGAEEVYSYLESRGGKFGTTTFFGLQYYLKKFLSGNITHRDIIRHAAFMKAHFGTNLMNESGWHLLVDRHKGRLPVSIKAVLEGTTVPTHNVLMTIRNTDPDFYWLPNYLETLLVQVWYPTTVCTLSRECKKVILEFLEMTGDPSLISFKLHDFGYRGVSSDESAGTGGAGHLVNFMGTDTLSACDTVLDYYSPPEPTEGDDEAYRAALEAHYGKYMPGFSIPASEHSTITSWGKDQEVEAFRNMLDTYPTGLVACVSDSFDIFNACRNLWGTQLRDKILNRNGTLVIRPDSGDPPVIVVKVLEILGEQFGYETNPKGYKVLNPHVRIIQGDGIDYEMIRTILQAMMDAGWSADNIAFGSGGALLQKMNRDTQKFAFKCSSIMVSDTRYGVWKDPITDSGKRSKRGILGLIVGADGKFTTVENWGGGAGDQLVEVYLNGEIKVNQMFSDIRSRAAI